MAQVHYRLAVDADLAEYARQHERWLSVFPLTARPAQPLADVATYLQAVLDQYMAAFVSQRRSEQQASLAQAAEDCLAQGKTFTLSTDDTGAVQGVCA